MTHAAMFSELTLLDVTTLCYLASPNGYYMRVSDTAQQGSSTLYMGQLPPYPPADWSYFLQEIAKFRFRAFFIEPSSQRRAAIGSDHNHYFIYQNTAIQDIQPKLEELSVFKWILHGDHQVQIKSFDTAESICPNVSDVKMLVEDCMFTCFPTLTYVGHSTKTIIPEGSTGHVNTGRNGTVVEDGPGGCDKGTSRTLSLLDMMLQSGNRNDPATIGEFVEYRYEYSISPTIVLEAVILWNPRENRYLTCGLNKTGSVEDLLSEESRGREPPETITKPDNRLFIKQWLSPTQFILRCHQDPIITVTLDTLRHSDGEATFTVNSAAHPQTFREATCRAPCPERAFGEQFCSKLAPHCSPGSQCVMGNFGIGSCCAVWGEWTDWAPCSKTCAPGVGVRTRTRRCQGRGTCQGQSVQFSICFPVTPCNRACTCGGWSSWGFWTQCPVTCGGDVRFRGRSCTVVPQGCPPASDSQAQSCGLFRCPVLRATCICGAWNNWKAWSSCSATCGTGISWRNRTCSLTTPGCDPITDSQSQRCIQQNCLVCGSKEVHLPCGSPCFRQCGQTSGCSTVCVPGCYCQAGFLRMHGVCVPKAACPSSSP